MSGSRRLLWILWALTLVAGVSVWGLFLWLERQPESQGVGLLQLAPHEQAGMTVPAGDAAAESPRFDLPTLGEAQPSQLVPPATASGVTAAERPVGPPVVVRVVDDLGLPVPGAELVLRSRLPGEYGWSAPKSTYITSDAQGLAVWTAYPGSGFSVDVWTAPDGYAPFIKSSLELPRPPPPDGDPPVLVLARCVDLIVRLSAAGRVDELERLRLMLPDGTTLAKAGPELRDGDVSWSVGPGTHTLIAYWSEGSGFYSPEQQVVVTAGEECVVPLQVRSGTEVFHGRVVDTAGEPVWGMPIQVMITRTPATPSGLEAPDHRTLHHGVSGSDGSWRLDGLPPGRAQLTAMVEDYTQRHLAARDAMVLRPMSVTAGSSTKQWSGPEGVELVLEPGYRVAGRVEGPWHEDWLAGRMELRVTPERPWGGKQEQRPQLGKDGAFLLEHCKAGVYEVRITDLRPAPTLQASEAVALLIDEAWRRASARFEIDPALHEGAVVHPVVILEP